MRRNALGFLLVASIFAGCAAPVNVVGAEGANALDSGVTGEDAPSTSSDDARTDSGTRRDSGVTKDDSSSIVDATSAKGKHHLLMVSGNGEVLTSMFPGTDPLRVLVTDDSGAPASGVPVTWKATKGDVVLVETTHASDAKGLSQTGLRGDYVPPGASFTDQVVTATIDDEHVDFVVTTITNNAPSIPVPPQAEMRAPDATVRDVGGGKVGSVLPRAIELVIALPTGPFGGRPMQNVGLRIVDPDDPSATPIAECVGGTALSNDKGIVTCDLVLRRVTGSGQLVALVGGFTKFDRIRIAVTP